MENLELKDLIQQMRQDMETIVLQVKESKLQIEYAKHQEKAGEENALRVVQMQQEIMIKERRIGDLERRLRVRDEEIEALK